MQEVGQFDKNMVIKLSSIINEEQGVARGTIGQSIEAVISKVNNINNLLEEILLDKNVELSIKHSAALTYAYYTKESSLGFLKDLEIEESWFIPELINQIEVYKWINPYG